MTKGALQHMPRRLDVVPSGHPGVRADREIGAVGRIGVGHGGYWRCGAPAGNPEFAARMNDGSDQIELDGLGNGTGEVVDLEFAVDVPDMGVHGVIRNTKLVGDFFFDQALGEQP